MTDWVSTNLVRGRTLDRSDRSQQRPAQFRPMRQEYRVKERKDEPVPMQVDSEKAPAAKVVQVEDGKGKAQDAQEGPVIVEKPVNVSQKLVLANDHEASSSNLKDQDKEKYFQPRGMKYLMSADQGSLKARSGGSRQLISLLDRSDHYNRQVRPVSQTGLTAQSNQSDRSTLNLRREPKKWLLLWLLVHQRFQQLL